MKKAYETPSVEVVKFNYNDQVVVASGCYSGQGNTDVGDKNCNHSQQQLGRCS